VTTAIVEENAVTEGVQPKSYSDVAQSNQIEGFTTDFSVNAGTTIDFKINVNGGAGSDYTVEIFRLGYYGGNGAREVAKWTNTNATVQPDASVDLTLGLVDAGNWSVTDSWTVPEDAVSGVYLARLQRLDANGQPIEGATSQIPFIVRNDGVAADIVLQTSDTTWHPILPDAAPTSRRRRMPTPTILMRCACAPRTASILRRPTPSRILPLE